MEVEGIDGTMLETDFQMWYYKQWFERAIRINEGAIRVIDATEGGAKIEGTEIRSFEETIASECKQELDIYRIEKDIFPTFSEEKQPMMLEKLKIIKQSIINFEKRIEEVIAEQEQSIALVKASKVSSDQLIMLLRETSEKSEEISKMPILEFVSMYAQKEEYEMGDSIYIEENLKPEELMEKSLVLLIGYQNGAKLLEEDIDEFILSE